jgi:hypothetical protein
MRLKVRLVVAWSYVRLRTELASRDADQAQRRDAPQRPHTPSPTPKSARPHSYDEQHDAQSGPAARSQTRHTSNTRKAGVREGDPGVDEALTSGPVCVCGRCCEQRCVCFARRWSRAPSYGGRRPLKVGPGRLGRRHTSRRNTVTHVPGTSRMSPERSVTHEPGQNTGQNTRSGSGTGS